MMKTAWIERAFKTGIWLCLLSCPLYANPDPMAVAADYYYAHHDYSQALQLWKQALEREPDDFTALSRVAELKLMLEGRENARDTLLSFIHRKSETISELNREKAKAQLGTLVSTFLTDEGQSDYLQAKLRLNHEDWAQALSLLNQANSLEKGNLKVLKEKARCELALASYDHYYASLKQAYETDPYDRDVQDRLSEAEVYFKEYSAAIALLQKMGSVNLSEKERIDLGVALAETNSSLALTFLKPLADSQRKEIPAVVYFEVGKLLASSGSVPTPSAPYLQNFISQTQVASPQPHPVPVAPVWDPYHTMEKVSEAQRLLQANSSPGKISD